MVVGEMVSWPNDLASFWPLHQHTHTAWQLNLGLGKAYIHSVLNLFSIISKLDCFMVTEKIVYMNETTYLSLMYVYLLPLIDRTSYRPFWSILTQFRVS
jgi:hypothetical protein